MTAQEQQIMDSLQAMNKSQAESLRLQTEQIEQLQTRIKELTAQIAWFQRQMFGRKSEKMAALDPNQLTLFDVPTIAEEVHQAAEEASKQIEEIKITTKQKRQNRKLLADLPVLKREILRPEGIDLSLYKKIGEEVTRVVEHEPGKLYIREIVREKYVPLEQNDEKTEIQIAAMPLLPINKGIAGPSLLAEVLLQKYEYHQPMYRQVQQYRHLGMSITESTIHGWFKPTIELLRPLYDLLVKEVFASGYVQADETTTPVVDHDKRKAAKEYLWMARAVQERIRIFHYAEGSRAGAVIETLAKEHHFKGYMQCDGFGGYEAAFRGNSSVQLVNCMAHIRRHFESALEENKSAAEYAIGEIQKLYQIERACKEMTDAERKRKRNELARPIMVALKVWMETEGIKYSERSLIGKAITYAYTRWDNMMHYLDEGYLLIDNNLAENAIRPVTLGRKNYLFCGNHEAAENMAVICSLLGTCKEQNVNPRMWLNDVIAKMPYMTKASEKELKQLLPQHWIKQHIEAMLTIVPLEQSERSSGAKRR